MSSFLFYNLFFLIVLMLSFIGEKLNIKLFTISGYLLIFFLIRFSV